MEIAIVIPPVFVHFLVIRSVVHTTDGVVIFQQQLGLCQVLQNIRYDLSARGLRLNILINHCHIGYCKLIVKFSLAFGPITITKEPQRSEEHTSELQSRQYLVCRLLLEKKKKYNTSI